MDDEYGYNGESHDYNDSQYLRARYYDTSSGTFPQQDSYLGEIESPITQNRYSYVHNNPITGDDPSGHRPLDADADINRDEILKIQYLANNAGKDMSYHDAELLYLQNAPASVRVNYQNTKDKAELRLAEANRIQAEELRRQAEERIRIVLEVQNWTEDAGTVGRRYFYSLLDKGMSYADAYMYALNIKNICDELSTDHMSALKKKIDSIDSEDLHDYFTGYTKESFTTQDQDANSRGTYINERDVYYSDFLRDLYATVPAGESFLVAGKVLAQMLLPPIIIGIEIAELVLLLDGVPDKIMAYMQWIMTGADTDRDGQLDITENIDPDGDGQIGINPDFYVGSGGEASETINANDIRFSQSSVNGAKDIIDDMEMNGWNGAPVDVVKMPDGKLTTVDNTRVLSARYAGIDVEANVHGFNDPISSDMAVRFADKSGNLPSTWGEAIINRINNQNGIYNSTYPYGSDITGWKGN